MRTVYDDSPKPKIRKPVFSQSLKSGPRNPDKGKPTAKCKWRIDRPMNLKQS